MHPQRNLHAAATPRNALLDECNLMYRMLYFLFYYNKKLIRR